MAYFNKLMVICAFLSISSTVQAENVRIAVASNFTHTIKALADRFEQEKGHKVTLIFGSTGKHYAQIKNGAPFDAFFAADRKRPELLEKEGIALPNTRFTYAVGKLVLWSPEQNVIDQQGNVLKSMQLDYVAIANPKLAPYGKAAQRVLTHKGVWKDLQRKLVRGENVGQTFQFVKTGNASLGFVAYSQVKQKADDLEGSLWKVPESLYDPIEQQAVLLQENPVAREFLEFAQNETSQTIIRDHGYSTL